MHWVVVTKVKIDRNTQKYIDTHLSNGYNIVERLFFIIKDPMLKVRNINENSCISRGN